MRREKVQAQGAWQYTLTRYVPRGDSIKYYFLVDGHLKYDVDKPSELLALRGNVKASGAGRKERRALKRSGWSGVAAKFSSRPRCNILLLDRQGEAVVEEDMVGTVRMQG